MRDSLILFALVAASRLASTIHYIEDTDSLRFALSVRDFSVAELRPHFPGYPVFSFVAKALTALTGSYAVAFSLIGAVATFGIVHYLQRLLRVSPWQPLGMVVAVLVLFNPLVWLLSNRYMPDLLGAACALAALYHLLQGRRDLGFFLAGLLAGIRLSYLPFVLPPVLLMLRTAGARGVVLGAGGVLVWLVPLVVDTGWTQLVAAASRQTEGHFTDFGGTVHTEPHGGERLVGLAEGLLAHGLGTYWPGRHAITVVVALGMAALLIAGIVPLRQRLPRRVGWVLVASWVTYLLWILLYQNVIHKSRHVLPLLPPLLLVASVGAHALLRKGGWGRMLAGAFVTAYALVTLVLVRQHLRPTAIAQAAEYLRGGFAEPLNVVSTPLVNFYLAAVGVDARFISADASTEIPRPPAGERVVAVGMELPWRERPSSTRVFYHNPYVNRMWPEVVVREYHVRGE